MIPGVDALSQLLQADRKDTSKGFADDAKKGNAFVVVAVTSFTIVFVLSDDLGFPHVLWYSSLFPVLTEEFMLRLQ